MKAYEGVPQKGVKWLQGGGQGEVQVEGGEEKGQVVWLLLLLL